MVTGDRSLGRKILNTDAPARRILLADADAFYVSVARLVDPEGAGRANILVIGGRSKRGVVTSASYEARQYGIRSAMPTATAHRLCPQAEFFPVPRKACVEKSRQIRATLTDLSPVVEPASIDEFYLDVTGMEGLTGGETLAETAFRFRTEVLRQTKISLSIGGGVSKLIAKLAAEFAKPPPGGNGNGVHVVVEGKEIEFMRQLPLKAIPGIGPKFQARLQHYGLTTVAQALEYSPESLQSWFGENGGTWLYRRVRGLSSSPVNSRTPARSMSHEETFADDINDPEIMERELKRLAVRVASDLRSKGLRTRTVSVKVKESDFTVRQRSRTFERTVSADRPILTTAIELLRSARKGRKKSIRLLGVALSQLTTSADTEQLGFFDEANLENETGLDRKISGTLDTINEKFGRKGIVRGFELEGPTR